MYVQSINYILNIILFSLCILFAITEIIQLIDLQLDFKPADIPHTSLRTMAKHVRRAMLQGNHEVFEKSFAEGIFVTVVV